MAALSLALFIVESFIPQVLPGMKIGLAYFPVVIIMFIGGGWKNRDAIMILAVRIILSAFVSGSLMSLYFSFAGGIMAVTAMSLTKLIIKERWAVIPAGIFSAVAHNIGQLLAASTVYTLSVWAYLPYLAAAAVINGFIIALVAYYLINEKYSFAQKLREAATLHNDSISEQQ